MAFRTVKKYAGSYEVYNGNEHIGEVYRMPYRNMSKSWRTVFNPDHRRYGERPISSSKKEAVKVLTDSVIFPL